MAQALRLPDSFVAGLPEGTLGWAPDTRNDVAWPKQLPLPALHATPTSVVADQLFDPKLLGIADVFLLSRVGEPWPGVPSNVVYKVLDQGGEPLSDADLAVTDLTGNVIVKSKTSSTGVVAVRGGGLPSPESPWLDYRFSRAGETQVERVSVWEMWRESARTGAGLAQIELRVPLPSVPLDRSTDLARSRVVSDEAKRRPAALFAVVDGADTSSLELDAAAGQSWVEIDLGRDKPVGEVEVVFSGAVPDLYTVSVGDTGTAELAPWIAERSGVAQAARWGQRSGPLTAVRLFGKMRRMRRVRLTVGPGQKALVVALRAYGLKPA